MSMDICLAEYSAFPLDAKSTNKAERKAVDSIYKSIRWEVREPERGQLSGRCILCSQMGILGLAGQHSLNISHNQ